ncbi:hypothetical protein [Metabacillus fastidiosus]|uniref:Type II secretion system protein GspF domain-containing protein n=1 Tax=Metabacillus fastidiosus TaxID=1458 RepID=A0ABU6NVR3_9BACI|nr:hypothetical protein [Metabacillus fastidiosus]MED4400329.1 hypothetical protein [Metabacillus fastidiosus]
MSLELLFALFVFVLLLMGLLYLYADNKEKNGQGKKKDITSLLPKKRNWKQDYNILALKSYTRFQNIPFLKGYVRTVRKRLETINKYDEYKLRRETMTILFTAIGVSSLIFLICALAYQNLVFLGLILLAIVFINGTLIDFFVHRLEDRLLKQFKEFLQDIRHHYQQNKMVDEAVYEASLLSPYEMKLQADSIYEMVTSSDPVQKLRDYENVAPNRFLRAFASICVLVFEKGDVQTEKGSAFLNGLTILTEEINYEIIHRSKLAYILKGLSVITVVPIFLLFPIRAWATTYLPAMVSFYTSQIGLLTQIFLYMTILLSYMIVRKMREINDSKYLSKSNRKVWAEKVYNIKPIKYIVDLLTPNYYDKEGYKLTQLIKDANSPIKIEWLYTQRLITAVVSFFLLLGLFFYSHHITIKNALYSPTSSVLMGKMTDEEKIEAEETTNFDRKVILHFKEVKDKKYEDVVHYINNEVKETEAKSTSDRIIKKMKKIDNSYFKWWELLISFLVSVIGYQIPILLLMFQAKLRKMDMEEEVNQFYTIINVISHFESISTENVLEWMERFAVIFKEPLKDSLLNFDNNPELALKELKENVSFPSFNRIVDRLYLAATRISVQEAFDDINLEKQFFVEQRNRHNEHVLKMKADWGFLIGLTPLYTIIFLYLVIPMIYISVLQTDNLFRQFL